MNHEKLTICFPLWMLFNIDDDFDRQMKEIRERGFNCIRIEDGAGLLWDNEGKPREKVAVYAPFGKYTKYTTYKDMAARAEYHLLDRLLRLAGAAKENGVRIILSSWFFLHTNWFCEPEDREPFFAMSPEEAMTFFGEELDRILTTLRQEGLIDVVAFAEIFNEFDGISFAGEYGRVPLSEEELIRIRAIHERELAKLKAHHPDVLFAYDCYNPRTNEKLIPRNIDVLNFHFYYAWNIYQENFEKNWCSWSLDESDIPEETQYYLKKDRITVAEVMEEMRGDVLTGLDWPRRISLYSSIAEEKERELQDMLESRLEENLDKYLRWLRKGVERIIDTHDRLVPNSRLVMGEGVGYCASPTLKFERDSEAYWNMVREQAVLLREKGLWGTVVRTNARPAEVTWDVCKDRYVEVNRLFAGSEE